MAVNVAGAVMVTACSHSRALDRRLGKISPSLGFAEARTASHRTRPIPRYYRRPARTAAASSRQFAMIDHSLISIVDDDESVRESLEGLLKSVGFRVEAFALATDFLNSTALHATDCLILDVRMPGMSGPELQTEVDREPALDPDHFHYGAWRRGGSRAGSRRRRRGLPSQTLQ